MSKIGQFIVVDRILKKQSLFFLLFSLIAGFILYYPTLNFEFLINFDDDLIILNHPELHQFSLKNLKEIFTKPLEGLYHPITSLSWMIDAHFFGLDPFYFHLQNIILHLINGGLLYIFILRLGFNRLSANLGVLLFLIHPMAVENVAWISSRKDLVLGVFFLSSLISYLSFLEKSTIFHFLQLLLFFILALLSKSAAVVLPVLFLLISWHKEKRFQISSFVKLIPFFILSIGIGIWTIKIQSEAGYIRDNSSFSILDRLFMFSFSIQYYLLKFFAPIDLSPKNIYPDKDGNLLPAIYYISLLINLFIGFLVYRLKKIRYLLLFAISFYLISISPVLKLIPTGNDIVSNRYAYTAYFGLFAVIPFLTSKKNLGTIIILAIAVLIGLKTFQYQSVFKDSIEVWTAVVEKNEGWGQAMALNERGQVHLKKGNKKAAMQDINEALLIEPTLERALMNRSLVYDQSNKLDNALLDLDKVLKKNENNIDALKLRGMIYGKKGQIEKALVDLDKAISLTDKRYDLFINRGIVHSLNNDYKKALDDFNSSIKLGPKIAENYINRANLYFENGEFELAKVDLEQAYKINSNIFRNNYLLAKTYLELDEKEKAESILNKYAGNQQFASNIAQQLLSDGYVKESIPFFNIAMGDPQIRDKSLYQRSQAYAQLEDYQNAIDDLFAILENMPNPQFFFEIGNYYQKLEEDEKACQYWEESSKRNYPPADANILEYCN